MGERTEIRWTDHTFNPWWGCARVSEACQHCYAESLAKRYGHDVWGKGGERRFFGEKHWNEPVRWNRKAEESGEPKLVFCASMADVFEDHPELPPERERLWDLVARTPWLTWQLLTKRPESIYRMVPSAWYGNWPVNVWVGVTVESQRWAKERLPRLVQVPAPVRFVSAEPLFGRLDLTHWLEWDNADAVGPHARNGVNWVIAGGESGPKARPSHPQWFRSLRDQCVGTGVPYLFKQWGEWVPRHDLRWSAAVARNGGTPEDGIQFKPKLTVVEPEWACGIAYEGNAVMERVGKKTAGWELDGRTWDEIPERRVA